MGVGERSAVAATCEDQLGGVWFYTKDGQLWRYREGQKQQFKTGGTENYYSNLRTVICDEAGRVWVGS
jgi:ligand-binding sensor domain-containing protein